MTSAAQIRAARALLGWTSPRLARSAKIRFDKALRAQDDEGVLTPSGLDLWAIGGAIEEAGVEFGVDGSVRIEKKV